MKETGLLFTNTILQNDGRPTMSEIKQMTDAELVEAVAREVMEFPEVSVEDNDVYYLACSGGDESDPWFEDFDPFHNMNDLFMVLEKFVALAVSHDETGNRCMISGELDYSILADIKADTLLARAVLEAALMARRGK